MTQLTLKRIEELDKAPSGPRVSLYCPLSYGAQAKKMNSTRLKNLLSRAWEQLDEAPVSKEETISLLEPRLNGERGSLAVFLDSDTREVLSIPVEVPQSVVVADRFHLQPLLGALEQMHQYLAVAVSLNQVTVYYGDATGAREIPRPEGMPRNLDEAIRWEKAAGLQPDQLYTTQPGGPGSGGHGKNPENHLEEEFRGRFLRGVVDGLKALSPEPEVCILVSFR